MIDLRSHGPAIASCAHTRHVPVSALIRTILGEWLAAHPEVDLAGVDGHDSELSADPSSGTAADTKVTLRMPALEALLLARRARRAEMSQGMYVAQLVNGVHPSAAGPDYHAARASLAQSTATLAALSRDMTALCRLIQTTSKMDRDVCAALAGQVSRAVNQHLAVASPLLTALAASRRSLPRKPV